MIIERFKYHEKFSVKSTFLDTSIDVEGVLEEGETLKEAVAKAREEILKSLPSSPLSTLDWGYIKDSPSSQGISMQPYQTHHPIQGPLPTISLEETPDQSNDIVKGIQEANRIDKLTSWKLLAGTNPEWTKLYMFRLKELTNGK